MPLVHPYPVKYVWPLLSQRLHYLARMLPERQGVENGYVADKCVLVVVVQDQIRLRRQTTLDDAMVQFEPGDHGELEEDFALVFHFFGLHVLVLSGQPAMDL
jgi:hypothetical protein